MHPSFDSKAAKIVKWFTCSDRDSCKIKLFVAPYAGKTDWGDIALADDMANMSPFLRRTICGNKQDFQRLH